MSGAFSNVATGMMPVDGDGYLNGAYRPVRVNVGSLAGWSTEMSYLEGMYDPLVSLEDDVEGGLASEGGLRAEADLHGRQVNAAGFMLDHVYAVEGTVADMRAAAAYAGKRYPDVDGGNARALTAAVEREALLGSRSGSD